MATDHEVLQQVKARQDKLERLIQDVKELRQTPPAVGANTGTATITVNMGGWGVAVAVCAALFCLLLVIDMRNDQRDSNRKIERAQDYNNMLWQRYPELRPENLKSTEGEK